MITSINQLRKDEYALEQALELIDKRLAKVTSLNDFDCEMSLLWEANQDLTEIKDACSDPRTNKDLVRNKLTEVRKQITDLNAGKKP